jgi:preprotein translocase subunit SecB
MIKPFQMLRYEILTLSIDQNEVFDAKADECTGDVQTSILLAPHKKDPRRWRIELTVAVLPVKGKEASFFPYHVKVRGRGYCIFKAKESKEDCENTLRLNGASILYGLMRAQVAQVTAQSTKGQFLLPVLNFFDIEAHRLNGPKAPEKAKT